MKKIITISGKEYTMKSSAYTQFKYKNDTGRKLLEDIRSFEEIQNLEENVGLADDIIDKLLYMAFIMIEEADSTQVKSYESFLQGLEEGLFDNADWIQQVVELAISPISRGIQGSSPTN